MADNAWEALKLDFEFYADYDEESAAYGVFGIETGFCYASYSDSEKAKSKADAMTATKQYDLALSESFKKLS